MVELLKKTLYASVGMALLSRDKAEKAAKAIAKEAELSREQGKKFVDDLVKKSEETKLTIERIVQEKVEKALKKTALATRREVAVLEERIRNLESEAGKAGKV
jgi:polyhydroxyalkanoate synthesis regulator phasin